MENSRKKRVSYQYRSKMTETEGKQKRTEEISERNTVSKNREKLSMHWQHGIEWGKEEAKENEEVTR